MYSLLLNGHLIKQYILKIALNKGKFFYIAFCSNSLSDITFFYGSMAIKLCEGDITTDNSDVIVNGVLSESFDLSKSEQHER